MSWINIITELAINQSSTSRKQRQFIGLILLLLMGMFLVKWYQEASYSPTLLIAFCATSLLMLKPIIVKPLLFAWLVLGGIMGEITSLIILGIIYFFFLTPAGFFKKKTSENGNWKDVKESSKKLKNLY